MLTKILRSRFIGQNLTKNLVRPFASAPLIGGMDQHSQPTENYADIDVPQASTQADSLKKSKGPVLPHFDYTPPKYTGPSYEEVKYNRKRYVSPASFHYYKEPLMITDGKMQYLYDHTGRRYLDYIAGVSTVGVGHCHPRIT